MKVVSTRCWTCLFALLGRGMRVPAHGPTTPCARVPLPGQCAETYCERRLRIWRASSSCWNAGDFEVTDRDKLSVIYQPTVPASTSPYRVRDEQGRELDWANAFLDGQRIRQLSACSLRIYAYDLLDFARWFEPQHQPLAEITESTLVDYVRHQLEQQHQ